MVLREEERRVYFFFLLLLLLFFVPFSFREEWKEGFDLIDGLGKRRRSPSVRKRFERRCHKLKVAIKNQIRCAVFIGANQREVFPSFADTFALATPQNGRGYALLLGDRPYLNYAARRERDKKP